MVEKLEIYRERINNLWREYDWHGALSINELNKEIDSILYEIQEDAPNVSPEDQENAILHTYIGLTVNLYNPEKSQIDIVDIAHALSKEQRYANHLDAEYSVADHCIACCEIMLKKAPKLALEALMHDATEAYLRDIPKPLKKIIPQYKALEKNFESVIAEKYKLKYPFPAEIKEVDMTIFHLENVKFRFDTRIDAVRSYGVDNGKAEFLNLFDKLKRT